MTITSILLFAGAVYYHMKHLITENGPYYEDESARIIHGVFIGIGLVIAGFIVSWLRPYLDGWEYISVLLLFTTGVLLLFDVIWVHNTRFDPKGLRKRTSEVEEGRRSITATSYDLGLQHEQITKRVQLASMIFGLIEHKKQELIIQDAQLTEKRAQLQRDREEVEANIEHGIRKQEEVIRQEYESRYKRKEEELCLAFHDKMNEFTTSMTDKMERRILQEKQELVDDVFSFEGGEDNGAFELRRAKTTLEQREAEVDKNAFMLEMEKKVNEAAQQVIEAKKHGLDIRAENLSFQFQLKEETINRERAFERLQSQMEVDGIRRESDRRELEHKLEMLGVDVKMRLLELGSKVESRLKDIEMDAKRSFLEVKENISDMRHEFGKEILRMDGQQGRILNELERYNLKNQGYVQEMQGLAVEARRSNLEGKNLLDRVNLIREKHQMELQGIEQKLGLAMDKVSVHEGRLANSVGSAMLKLKSISDEQYATMRDLALEKKDTNLLWREKNIEHDRNLEKVAYEKRDLERLREQFELKKSNAFEQAKLQHNLYMTEQRYTEALSKANSSGGFLSRVARGIEEAWNKSKR